MRNLAIFQQNISSVHFVATRAHEWLQIKFGCRVEIFIWTIVIVQYAKYVNFFQKMKKTTSSFLKIYFYGDIKTKLNERNFL